MVQGSFVCGALRYEADETQVIGAMHCHCSDCRKATGSGKASIVNFPKTAIKLTGEYKVYQTVGKQGAHVNRGFCPECGSQMITLIDEMPDIMFIKAGTMDESDWVKFDANLWVSTAPKWDPADENLPSFSENPTS